MSKRYTILPDKAGYLDTQTGEEITIEELAIKMGYNGAPYVKVILDELIRIRILLEEIKDGQ